MALLRLLVVSNVIDKTTNEVIGTSCGLVTKPTGETTETILVDTPVPGYDIHVEIHDTYVSQKFDELVAQGADILKFK